VVGQRQHLQERAALAAPQVARRNPLDFERPQHPDAHAPIFTDATRGPDDQWHWSNWDRRVHGEWRVELIEEQEIMTYILGIAVVLMVAGAICLVAGIGAAGLWIAAIAVGIALVIVERVRGSHSLS